MVVVEAEVVGVIRVKYLKDKEVELKDYQRTAEATWSDYAQRLRRRAART